MNWTNEAISSLAQQIFGYGEIYGGRIGVNVPKESGEIHQPAVGISEISDRKMIMLFIGAISTLRSRCFLDRDQSPGFTWR
jgi:hypothetical protein